MNTHPTPLEALRSVRSLLASPDAWCQGDFALGPLDEPHTPREVKLSSDPLACSWCILGALEKVLDREPEHYEPAVHALLTELRERTAWSVDVLSIWNDSPERMHSDVLDLIDRSIAALEAA